MAFCPFTRFIITKRFISNLTLTSKFAELILKKLLLLKFKLKVQTHFPKSSYEKKLL